MIILVPETHILWDKTLGVTCEVSNVVFIVLVRIKQYELHT